MSITNIGCNGVKSANSVSEVVVCRGITRICHITPVYNLVHILKNNTGILATDFIPAEYLCRNDLERYDRKTDYISASVQYPNFWYYNRKKSESSVNVDWAVILIDPGICRDDNTLFSPYNAAKRCGRYLKPGADAFREMFAESLNGRLRDANRLRNCPTEDQAEIMIYKKIPTYYFRGIVFETPQAAERFISLAAKEGLEYPPIFYAPAMFSTQMSNYVREGYEAIMTPVSFGLK